MATNPMKVDLEALERDTRLYQFPVLDLETLNSLIAEVRAARQAQTLLKRIQWSGWSYNEQDGTHTSICPECDARFRDGHRPVCALAKLIADPPAALASPSVPTGAVAAQAFRDTEIRAREKAGLCAWVFAAIGKPYVPCRLALGHEGEHDYSDPLPAPPCWGLRR